MKVSLSWEDYQKDYKEYGIILLFYTLPHFVKHWNKEFTGLYFLLKLAFLFFICLIYLWNFRNYKSAFSRFNKFKFTREKIPSTYKRVVLFLANIFRKVYCQNICIIVPMYISITPKHVYPILDLGIFPLHRLNSVMYRISYILISQ